MEFRFVGIEKKSGKLIVSEFVDANLISIQEMTNNISYINENYSNWQFEFKGE